MWFAISEPQSIWWKLLVLSWLYLRNLFLAKNDIRQTKLGHDYRKWRNPYIYWKDSTNELFPITKEANLWFISPIFSRTWKHPKFLDIGMADVIHPSCFCTVCLIVAFSRICATISPLLSDVNLWLWTTSEAIWLQQMIIPRY